MVVQSASFPRVSHSLVTASISAVHVMQKVLRLHVENVDAWSATTVCIEVGVANECHSGAIHAQ